jgi:hypothetical protein
LDCEIFLPDKKFRLFKFTTSKEMKTINNIAEWIRSISSGEVKYGSLSRYSAHALRCAASNFNKTLGHDRGIFVHIHFDWDKMIAIAVCISVAERSVELKDREHANDWKKKIPSSFD